MTLVGRLILAKLSLLTIFCGGWIALKSNALAEVSDCCDTWRSRGAPVACSLVVFSVLSRNLGGAEDEEPMPLCSEEVCTYLTIDPYPLLLPDCCEQPGNGMDPKAGGIGGALVGVPSADKGSVMDLREIEKAERNSLEVKIEFNSAKEGRSTGWYSQQDIIIWYKAAGHAAGWASLCPSSIKSKTWSRVNAEAWKILKVIMDQLLPRTVRRRVVIRKRIFHAEWFHRTRHRMPTKSATCWHSQAHTISRATCHP